MRSEVANTRQPAKRRSGADLIAYGIIFLACFAVFLPAAICECLLPRSWRRAPNVMRPLPCVIDVWKEAHRCTTLAFSG